MIPIIMVGIVWSGLVRSGWSWEVFRKIKAGVQEMPMHFDIRCPPFEVNAKHDV